MLSRQQKKRFRRILFIVFGILLFSISGWILYQWLLYRKAKFSHYPEFGIAIPQDYSIHGIDVSKYQSLIAWKEVKAMKIKNVQMGFVFIICLITMRVISMLENADGKKSKRTGA